MNFWADIIQIQIQIQIRKMFYSIYLFYLYLLLNDLKQLDKIKIDASKILH